MPEAKQNTSKLAEMFARASVFTALVGIAVDVVRLSMALLSFRGFDTPRLPAQGEQRRSSFFNIRRDIPPLHQATGQLIGRLSWLPPANQTLAELTCSPFFHS